MIILFIYKITNIKNNKIYVGQTRRSKIELRFKEHIKQSMNKNSKYYNFDLYKDLRKYGKRNFKIEVLEEIFNEEDLLNKEDFYILKYNSINKGYNKLRSGKNITFPIDMKKKISESQKGDKNHMYGKNGKLNPASKPVRCITENKTFNSLKEASDYYNLSTSLIRGNIKGRHKCCGKKIGKKLNFEYIYEGYNPFYVSHAKIKKKMKKPVKDIINITNYDSLSDFIFKNKLDEEKIRNFFSQHKKTYINKDLTVCIVDYNDDRSLDEIIKEIFRIKNTTKGYYYLTLPSAINDLDDYEYDKTDYEKLRSEFRRNDGYININNNKIIKLLK
jgi:group I intron endonuclease